MKASFVEALIEPKDYANLTDEQIAARFLAPMICGLRHQSGTRTTEHQFLLRMSIREVTDLEMQLAMEEDDSGGN